MINVHTTTRYATAEGTIAQNGERRHGDLDGMGQTQYRRRREKCEERQPGVERDPAPTVAAKVIDVYERQGAHRSRTQ